jgi:outer membrane receptor for ferrienterochelin and colicins
LATRRAASVVIVACVACVAAPITAHADAEVPPGPKELAELPIEGLMQVPIVTPSKAPTTIAEAPAIVSVVTREEIVTWGYQSVAEALKHVPGFYAVDDWVTPNFGVRGLNAGQRGYNRILKLLVNGQPVGFRSDGTNFLGPELIPMEAIERIEVVRGPASALYGENAYLAVVNIITRKPEPNHPGSVGAGAGYGPRFGASGEVLLQHASGPCGVLGAFSGSRRDRSGLSLPASSPRLDTFADRTSANDVAKPISAFATFECKLASNASVQLQALYSRLDAHGEYLDFGALSHDNRIVQQNFVGRTKLRLTHSPWLETVVAVGAGKGGPSDAERLNDGSATTRPRRYFGYKAIDFLFESMVKRERYSLLAGADYVRDVERPLTIFVETDGASRAPLGVQPERVFHNIGVYGQALARPIKPLPGLGVSANIRYDHHNIYGGVINYHLGLAHSFGEALTAKLLGGTSYQAPNAYHLYAQPLYAGDVAGNPALKPQRATTAEAQVIVRPFAQLLVATNVYYTRTRGRIELVPRGITSVQPQNTQTATAIGTELETRWTPGRHRVTGIVQVQNTKEETEDPFLGTVSTPSSSYPRTLAEVSWAFRTTIAGTFGLRGSYVSARRASKSNIEQNNAPYLLDPYVLFGATWLHEIGAHARLRITVNNVLGTTYAEPGFNGVDFPGRRREAMASFTWLM